MNPDNQTDNRQKPEQETWPQKLNKALIAIGIIAFGLIITDRVIEMFSADDAPAVQAEVQRTDTIEVKQPSVVTELTQDASSDSVATVTASHDAATAAVSEQAAVQNPEPESVTVAEAPAQNDATPSVADDEVVVADGAVTREETATNLEEVFGSRVVFVSASEPVYVVTEDDRRFEVGSEIDPQTTLAGVTAKQLILEHAGDLTVISLPDPNVQ